MTMNTNSQIMNLMKDLVLIRDNSIGLQKYLTLYSFFFNCFLILIVLVTSFTVYLAKTTTEDNKANNRSIDSTNVSGRPHILSERSAQNSPLESTGNISRTPRKSSHRPNETVSRQLNIARNATTHSSQLPLTLENPPHPPNIVHFRKTDPSQIAAKIEAQCSNARLTSGEREALISRILTNELAIQSKLAAQAGELFPKAETFQRRSTPSKLDRKARDQLMASLMEKRLQIESNRAAQERLIFSPTVGSEVQRETPEAVAPKTFDVTPDGTTSAGKKRRAPVSSLRRRTRQDLGKSLAPILETSEPRDSTTGIDDGARSGKGNNRHDMDTILAKENDRRQQMESRLPDEMIQDIETDLLLKRSDESDSLDDLVIKDFAIHIVESEPDPVTSSLPITEQVILESNKLKEMIESVKDRFQVKVARDKFAERNQRKQQPTQTRVKVPTQSEIKLNVRKSQQPKSATGNDGPARSFTKPSNIMDSHNWGNVALPKPLLDVPVEPSNSNFDDSVLSQTDMQFDDLFGVDNVLEPADLRSVSQYEPQLNNKINGQSERETESSFSSVENIEDFESPQFSDNPLDVSGQSIRDSLDRFHSIRDLADPQSSVEGVSDKSNESPSKPPKAKAERTNQQLSDGSTVEGNHEKDIQTLKQLIDSGALASSVMNQRFEEGVLDLLLRQSDSLWDPIVAGIPIIYFIPSRNHERGLLDTSIQEGNLESPLIKKPERKLPEFMESLEKEWRMNVAENGDSTSDAADGIDDSGESLLLPGLPEFSYKPAPGHHYRKKVNIMDSIEESDDDDHDILDDEEMNFDDLFRNAAEPTYDFQKAKIMDDLQIKMRQIRRMTTNSGDGSTNGVGRVGTQRKDKSSPKYPAEQGRQNRSEPAESSVNIRRSVSFVDGVQDSEPSKHGKDVRSNGDVEATSQATLPESSEVGRWTTLHISEIRDLIEHARLAQTKHRAAKSSRID